MTIWVGATWEQFGAAIEMLENAIRACPERLWDDSIREPRFWYLAYHTLFFLDYYSSDSAEGFQPPSPFTLDELDPAGVLPPRAYSKSELLDYLAHGRAKCRSAVSTLTDERASQVCGFAWLGLTVAGWMLYNLRHVQHHVGQMNILLRHEGVPVPAWVSKASDPRAT